MKSGRGGIRENAGRKTSWVSGRGFNKTKIIRVPIEFAEQLLQIAHKLDAGESIDLVTKPKNEPDMDLALAKELVTESLERAMVDLVTEPKQELNLGLTYKELVTESKEQVTIEEIKGALAKWRQRSDEAKITSPKSERWAKARQMLNELEPIVFGVALLPEKPELEVATISPSLVALQIDLDTESKRHELNDSVSKSDTSNTELLELVTESEAVHMSEDAAQSPNQLNLLSETEYQAKNSKHKLKELISLTRSELAERFGIKVESLGNRLSGKMATTFSKWSQRKDPDGITWQYYPETKLFFPLVENVTNSIPEAILEKGN